MEPKKETPKKGKGREIPPQTEPQEPSLASRIASSASGLAKDLVGTSSGKDIQGQLASTSGLSGKLGNGSSSSASQSAWTQDHASHPRQRPQNASATSEYVLNGGESFRSTDYQPANDQEFNEFLNGSNMNDVEAYDFEQHANSWTGDFHDQSNLNLHSHDALAFLEQSWSGNYSQNPDHDDGAEVRMLLSDSSFQPAWEESEVMTAAPAKATVAELFPQNYSPSEQRAADRIRNALPPPPVHGKISSLNPLNLRPDFESAISHMHSELDSAEVSNIEGLNTPRRQQLVSEWDGVLNGYTDEVWGDMLPAVKEARSQLQEVKAGSERLDNRAVTRLKMILGHVVQSADPLLLNIQAPTVAESTQDQGQKSGAVREPPIGTSMHQHGILLGNKMNQWKLEREQRLEQEARLQGSESMKQAEKSSGQERASSLQMHQQHVRKDSPVGEQGRENDASDVAFHCPWISCHQRFNNPRELCLHTSVHTQYACPHEDCTAEFKSHEEWADHIEGPHHDLLDTGFRSRRHSPN